VKYNSIRMRLLFLVFLQWGLVLALQAQEIRFIKITETDTQISIPAAAKKQWLQQRQTEKPKAVNGKISLQGSAAEKGLQFGRWVAARQGKQLCYVNLAAWMSKYIGETEKNLGILFDKAAAENAVLFFDEADALFGKATEPETKEEGPASISVYFLERIQKYPFPVLLWCPDKNCAALKLHQRTIPVIHID
jgi:ATPase family associated with various cellular activities (AAA)